MSLSERWQLQLRQLDEESRLRSMALPAGIDFSSNDYLGYALRNGPSSDLSRSGTASRLLRGHHAVWEQVEAKLADWHGAEAALMFTSGYAANEGLLSTILAAGDTIFSDQFNHASIIDGLRLSRAERVVFPHNDVNELESLMRERRPARGAHQDWFVVTESLFGMEANQAPLRDLAELAERYQAHLVVDEAHATGCFGAHGGGLVDALGLRQRVLATVHTGGKALALPGAYIVGTRLLRDILINRCRHFVFTTALPPQVGAWWLDMLERISTDEPTRAGLHDRASLFRKQASLHRLSLGGADYLATIILGTDADAMKAARSLQQAGYDIRAIRPPTVPPGTARLRISIHADHDAPVLLDLVNLLATLMRSSP